MKKLQKQPAPVKPVNGKPAKRGKTVKKKKKNRLSNLSTGILLLIVICLLLGGGLSIGFGNGADTGNGDGPAGTHSLSIGSDSKVSGMDSTESTAGGTKTQEPIPTATETPTVPPKTIVEISVVEKDYFYLNKRIELEEFVRILSDMDKNIVVMITDDNATLNAYNKLTACLDDLSVAYSDNT